MRTGSVPTMDGGHTMAYWFKKFRGAGIYSRRNPAKNGRTNKPPSIVEMPLAHTLLAHTVYCLLALLLLFLLSGCQVVSVAASVSMYLRAPARPVKYTFDLSARQSLRDLSGDFSAHKSGADTGITLLPGEKVELFATGSASVQPGGMPSGPEGIPTCHEPAMPEPSLPCYSAIYSVGITGQAGEVGTHVGFDPAVVGNLFLGINAPDLTDSTGSFHMTVFIVPSGAFTGVWAQPDSGFVVQGTALRLSAYVFAQNVVLNGVQFTMALPGQAPVSICDAFRVVGDLYTCDWDLTLNETNFHNGPVTLGFRLNGNTEDGVALAPVINPDGVRAGTITYVTTQTNDIYAGYAALDFTHPAAYQKVTGRWTVPTAHCSPGENSDSSVWVGMSSDASDQSLLAQLGTESACQDGQPLYYVWWEMFPAYSVPLDFPLQPGDTATATVAFQHGKFRLSIDVPSEGIHFSTVQAGKVSDTSIAECIVEPPTITDLTTNKSHVAQLTNFGKVSIRCQLNGDEPISDGPQDVLYQMQTQSGVAKAVTSALDQTGAGFTVQWQHG